jgi:hypothetical protein
MTQQLEDTQPANSAPHKEAAPSRAQAVLWMRWFLGRGQVKSINAQLDKVRSLCAKLEASIMARAQPLKAATVWACTSVRKGPSLSNRLCCLSK